MDKVDKKRIDSLLLKLEKELPNVKDVKEKKQKNSENNNDLNIIEQIRNEFELLLKLLEEADNEKLLAIADKQNSVRRFQDETIQIKKYGGESLASSILPAIDMFKKVLKTPTESPELKNYLIGFEMISNQIDQGLSSAGVSIIETKPGDAFNPEFHTAIEVVETDAQASGLITTVINDGYKLYDRVIKHAAVKVAK